MKITQLAFPTEHGAWGFMSESLLLGLLLAPTPEGLLMALACFFIFLLYQPVKIIVAKVSSELQPKPSRLTAILLGPDFIAPDSRVDEVKRTIRPADDNLRILTLSVLIIGYSLAAFIFLFLVLPAVPQSFWTIPVMTLPLIGIQWTASWRRDVRSLRSEISGALAVASIAPMILLIGSWSLQSALLVWLLLAVRSSASIYFIRQVLAASRGKPYSFSGVRRIYLEGLVILALLMMLGHIPMLAFVSFGYMALRSIKKLRTCQNMKARDLGLFELRAGWLNVFLIAIGYWLFF